MTREDAITVLNMVEAHGSIVIQAKEMAIKALEQEDVLDKIRAEIMSLDYIDEDKYEGISMSPMIDRDDVIEIIDKYRVESEDKLHE